MIKFYFYFNDDKLFIKETNKEIEIHYIFFNIEYLKDMKEIEDYFNEILMKSNNKNIKSNTKTFVKLVSKIFNKNDSPFYQLLNKKIIIELNRYKRNICNTNHQVVCEKFFNNFYYLDSEYLKTIFINEIY